jgi:hypothetical protein
VPLRNRVTPLGELIVTPQRGLVYANRGCLHDSKGEIRRAFDGRRWIACRLRFRGWKRSPLIAPGRFTPLFFLDEATALAAGHRPCALCRREDYNHLTALWTHIHPGHSGSDDIDEQLHRERIRPGTRVRRLHRMPSRALPDGTFVLSGGRPRLVLGDELLDWSPGGYRDPRRRPTCGEATVITPPLLVELLRGERTPLVPLLHPSATA